MAVCPSGWHLRVSTGIALLQGRPAMRREPGLHRQRGPSVRGIGHDGFDRSRGLGVGSALHEDEPDSCAVEGHVSCPWLLLLEGPVGSQETCPPQAQVPPSR